MIKTAKFMGALDARAMKPDSKVIVVSMLSHSEEWNRPEHLNEFKDHLVLQFMDVHEAYWEDQWPDRLNQEQHRQACGVPLERAPEWADAIAIVAFLEKHAKADEEVHLIAHCMAGASRSPAVAQFAADVHGAVLPQIGDDWLVTTEGANPRLMRLLKKAAETKN
jgi:predicted protein tyrosine phosphatase